MEQSDEDLHSNIANSQNSNTDESLEKRLSDAKKDVKNQRNNIWIINSILSIIFSYTDFTDLIEFSTVCKRWNNLINPIIHKCIKLVRSEHIQNEIHREEIDLEEIDLEEIDLEVGECISNSINYSHFIKELSYYETLEYQRTVEFFSTFNNLTKLTAYRVKYSQNEFLDMLSQLNKLQELDLHGITVDCAINNESRAEIFQLPLTLKKLKLEKVNLINNPEYLVKAINSHTNLVEFSFILNDPFIIRPTANTLVDFLEPFSKNYPSLRSLEFEYHSLSNPQYLFNIFECNPQLTSLKLRVSSWNDLLMNRINQHLINLENFEFYEIHQHRGLNPPLSSKFIRPTKIKNLSLNWRKLTQISLISILQNCPDLEELMLNHYINQGSNNNRLSFDLVNNVKIKKLRLLSDDLNSFEKILKSCPNLNDLEIALSENYKLWIMTIGENCKKLEKLTIKEYPESDGPDNLTSEERENILKDVCEMEFLTNNLSYKSTITQLTFRRYDFCNTSVEYFERFNKLKFIKFPGQNPKKLKNYIKGINFDKDSWPNYKLITNDKRGSINVTLIKLR